jgi:lipoprotein-releasing system permease protein
MGLIRAGRDDHDALTPYEARPWTRDFSTFLSNMQMMGASAYLISVFSLIASGFAIASVLVVSVLQKSAQIGILKSHGRAAAADTDGFCSRRAGRGDSRQLAGRGRRALRLYVSAEFIDASRRRRSEKPPRLFSRLGLFLYISWTAMLAAIVSTVVAAVLPARRAARLNPVDVMRSIAENEYRNRLTSLSGIIA